MAIVTLVTVTDKCADKQSPPPSSTASAAIALGVSRNMTCHIQKPTDLVIVAFAV